MPRDRRSPPQRRCVFPTRNASGKPPSARQSGEGPQALGTSRGRARPEASIAKAKRSMMIEPYKLARGLGWFSLALGAAELFAASPIGRMLGTRRTGWICAFGSREVAAGLVILARSRPGAGPIWFRVGGDVLDLACLGVLMASGGRQTGTVAATAAVAGATAADLYCALTLGKGACDPLAMRSSITVGGSPEELYAQWRDSADTPDRMRNTSGCPMRTWDAFTCPRD